MDPFQLTIDVWNTATQKSLTDDRMHIYLGQMYPLQLTIDIWNTTTPNMFNM